jgi:DNA-binding CsgD family transcriptional regulator
MARRRDRALRTIANQLASIYRKLGVSTRQELVARLNGFD